MKKQLDNKNPSKKPIGAKGLAVSTTFQRNKEPINANMNRKDINVKVEQPRTSRGNNSFVIPPKTNPRVKVETQKQEKHMVPKRMLNDK